MIFNTVSCEVPAKCEPGYTTSRGWRIGFRRHRALSQICRCSGRDAFFLEALSLVCVTMSQMMPSTAAKAGNSNANQIR